MGSHCIALCDNCIYYSLIKGNAVECYCKMTERMTKNSFTEKNTKSISHPK